MYTEMWEYWEKNISKVENIFTDGIPNRVFDETYHWYSDDIKPLIENDRIFLHVNIERYGDEDIIEIIGYGKLEYLGI